MSEQQIQQILKRLDEQDKKSEERLNAQYKIYQTHSEQMKNLSEKLESVSTKTDDMYKIFTGVSSAGDIAVWFLKGFILIATALGILYGFLLWLKK